MKNKYNSSALAMLECIIWYQNKQIVWGCFSMLCVFITRFYLRFHVIHLPIFFSCYVFAKFIAQRLLSKKKIGKGVLWKYISIRHHAQCSWFSWKSSQKIPHSWPVRASYEVSFVGSHSDLYKASGTAAMYAISDVCNIMSYWIVL